MSAWISVKDRRPEADICKSFHGLATDGRTVFTAWYWLHRYDAVTEEKQFLWTYEKHMLQDIGWAITHWMPLPEPPL